MNKKVDINGCQISYHLRKRKGTKRLKIAVYCDARVVVTKPWWVSVRQAENFLIEKGEWVIKRVEYFKSLGGKRKNEDVLNDYLNNKDKALQLAIKKIGDFNRFYNFAYNKISIKNQSTRWGSCSSKKNLNFNYRIVHLDERLLDYIIVHELCHLKEMNHSKDFWNLVASSIPEYQHLRKKLKNLI